MNMTALLVIGGILAAILLLNLVTWVFEAWDGLDAEIDRQRVERDERDRMLGRPYTRRFWENL